jgi:Uma2 family endonuclease
MPVEQIEMALLKENPEPLITGEELLRRPDLGRCELVDGRIIPLPPTEPNHGRIESRLDFALQLWARFTGRGQVLVGDAGIYLRRNPDTVRAPDVLYISNERYAQYGGTGYLNVAPELAVEVLSPSDRWSEVTEKVEAFLRAGVDRVWVVDPRLKRVSVYWSPTKIQHLHEGETLTDEELLPGFQLDVSEIFQI